MDTHTEEEDRVDELDADNPHRYLFGDDPIEPPAPQPMPPPPPIQKPAPEPEIPTEKHTPPTVKVAPPSSPPSMPTSASTRSYWSGSYDDRFKTTVDFQTVVKTLVKLKDQREQGLVDLQRLEKEREKALRDPQMFVSDLFSKRDVIPRRQLPPNVPVVEFSVYEKLPVRTDAPPKPATKTARKPASTVQKSVPQHTPWTLEEQRRLEQLLIEYPDEPVAAYRWEKIARALNRTPRQVVSRIHRYFERLARAGLPIPGRLPENSSRTVHGTGGSAHEKSKRGSTAHATSSHSQSAPPKNYNWMEAPVVKMDTAIPHVEDSALLLDHERAAFAGLEHTEEYKELIRLKRLKMIQERSHESYLRMDEDSNHHESGRESQPGDNFHSITDTPTQFIDSDYALSDDMSYLDPNYMAT